MRSTHDYDSTTSSGISRGIGASDLIVSLGSFTNGVGSVNNKPERSCTNSATTSRLQHGGGDSVNYKPNYLSVMSYAFQINGLIKNGVGGTFDYFEVGARQSQRTQLEQAAGIRAARSAPATIVRGSRLCSRERRVRSDRSELLTGLQRKPASHITSTTIALTAP